MNDVYRIRVREEQAQILFQLVWEERGRLVRERGRWKRSVRTTDFNYRIALMDSIKEELYRAAEEGGWDYGESGE
jgi:hypothetical protein